MDTVHESEASVRAWRDRGTTVEDGASGTNQTPLTQRVDSARGMISEPCCMKPPTGNHRLFPNVYWFSRTSRRSRRHG